jgi:hypothetical protein
MHWRLLSDRSVAVVTFSERMDDLCPLEEGNVRAELILAGYVLRPTKGGTDCTYIVQSDLKGNIPTSIVNMVSANQPMVLANACKALEQQQQEKKKAASGTAGGTADPMPLSTLIASFSQKSLETLYDELCYAREQVDGESASSAGCHPAADGDNALPVRSAQAQAQAGAPSMQSSSGSGGNQKEQGSAGAGGGSGTGAGTASSSRDSTSGSTSKQQALGGSAGLTGPRRWGDGANAMDVAVLLLPPLAHYASPTHLRSWAFLLALFVALRYIVRVHLGEARSATFYPETDNSSGSSSSSSSSNGDREGAAGGGGSSNSSEVLRARGPEGTVILRFPVELSKLLRYIESKRESTGVEITLTHVALKATAACLQDCPEQHGVLGWGGFYCRSWAAPIDLSVNVGLSGREAVMLKISDAALKPLPYLANELTLRAAALRQPGNPAACKAAQAMVGGAQLDDWLSRRAALRAKFTRLAMPQWLIMSLDGWLDFFGSALGLSIPILGVVPHPLGAASIITSPHRDGEGELDLTFVPVTANSGVFATPTAAPVTVTIGGVRQLAILDNERHLQHVAALNVSVTMNTAVATLVEARRFCALLQQYMAQPALLDKADRRRALRTSASTAK